MSDLAAAVGAGVPGVAAPTVAGPTGMIGVFQSLLTGFPLSGMLGYITLLILTVFPVTGILGLNLVAVGEPISAFLKAGSCLLSVTVMVFLSAYLPLFIQGQWMSWIAGLGPWYIYDILQMVDINNFNKRGFRPVLPIPFVPSGGGKGSSWRLTASFVNLFLATLAGSGQVLPMLFPDLSIGGVSGTTIGNSLSIVSGAALGISAIGSLAAVAFAPSIAPASVVAALAPKVGGGSSIPLSEFMDTLSKPTITQDGGGGSESIFLYILGFVAITGICMGFARSKQ